jgi:hypothetical protein
LYVHHPLTNRLKLSPLSFDGGELYLEELECDWFCYRETWKVREYPLLSVMMREPAPLPLTIQPIMLAGDLDKSTVRRYLKRNYSALARCQAVAEPSLALGRGATSALGEVFAQILIRGDGRVAHVVVADGRDDVVACVKRALYAIEFPRAPNNGLTQVNVPLRYGTTVASAGLLVR